MPASFSFPLPRSHSTYIQTVVCEAKYTLLNFSHETNKKALLAQARRAGVVGRTNEGTRGSGWSAVLVCSTQRSLRGVRSGGHTPSLLVMSREGCLCLNKVAHKCQDSNSTDAAGQTIRQTNAHHLRFGGLRARTSKATMLARARLWEKSPAW